MSKVMKLQDLIEGGYDEVSIAPSETAVLVSFRRGDEVSRGRVNRTGEIVDIKTNVEPRPVKRSSRFSFSAFLDWLFLDQETIDKYADQNKPRIEFCQEFSTGGYDDGPLWNICLYRVVPGSRIYVTISRGEEFFHGPVWGSEQTIRENLSCFDPYLLVTMYNLKAI